MYRWKRPGLNDLVHLFLLILYGGQQTLHIHLSVIVVLLPPLVHLCNLLSKLVLKAIVMGTSVFWDIMLCGLLK
jgi:hypothetical protein